MQSEQHSTQPLTHQVQIPPEVQQALIRFEEIYFDSIQSIAPTITKASELVQRQTAKQLRPQLLLLTAHSFGPLTEQVVNGSVFVELMHLATLIHDDVIDESYRRRGVPSMNAVFDNRKAILIGDYFLSKALTIAVNTCNKSILLQLAKLGTVLSEGELLQMDTAELGNYSEKRYIEIIDRKTASLIESSMLIGALLTGVEDQTILNGIERAGRLLGRAFQIRDDIFDYLPTPHLGKPWGQDIAEHKVTLPLIYALQQKSRNREKVLKLLRHEELKQEEKEFIINFATRMGGLEYATAKMHEMIEEAKELLLQVVPPSESREALLHIADFIATRQS